MNIVKKTIDLGNGQVIEIETGKLAKQADGSAVVRMNNTMLLATVCAKKEAGENVDFMPLTVEYQEKYAAMGRFPGGFFKREARPSEYEILIARLVDRALRPLFPDDFLCYFSGLTNMSFKKFALIIVLGKPWCLLIYSIVFSLALF